jgi:hypothetical protein
VAALVSAGFISGSAWAGSFTFTNDADWDTGIYTSTNSGPPGADNQLQLNPDITTPFNHIWVAASGRGTAIRIDTNVNPTTIGNLDSVLTTAEAGGVAVKGEYYTAPSGLQRNPSRTTVDQNGDVWVGNRNEAGLVAGVPSGSAAKILANPGAGSTTSNGIFNSAANGGAGGTFNALPWTNAGGADTAGGTSTAADDALALYVRTPSIRNVRALAVNADNNVWIGGNNDFSTSLARPHRLLDGSTGAAIGGAGNSFNTSVSTDNGNNGIGGGYGMVIDGNGVVWAASLEFAALVRHDPLTDDTRRFTNFNGYTYGLGVDNNGKIWVSNWAFGTVQKVNGTTGAIEGTFAAGAGWSNLRGVAVTPNDNDVWVASSSHGGVVRFNNDGTVQSRILTRPGEATGVAVDSNGKVWVTNYSNSSVSRIDPAANGGNGAVDLTIELGGGANPYNYSDMTGTVLIGTTNPTGSWRSVIDAGLADPDWDKVLWNETGGFEGGGTDIMMQVRCSDAMGDLSSAGYQEVAASGGGILGCDGMRYLEVRATLTGFGSGDAKISPILADLRVTTLESNGVPEPGVLWLLAIALGAALRLSRRR